jgi:anti-sigma-K factor RskA
MTDCPLSDDEEDAALCAEYALGLLATEERHAFEARMAVDPEFRARAILWTEDVVALADAVPEVTPPPGAEQAIRARLFPDEGRSLFSRLGLLPAMAAGLIAALLVLWVSSSGQLKTDPAIGPALSARVAAADGSLVVIAALSDDGQVLQLSRLAGAPLAGRVLELWLIPEGGTQVSLGVLPEGVEVALPVAPDLDALMRGATLAISDEPPGGSLTGTPTGEVRASGPVTEL